MLRDAEIVVVGAGPGGLAAALALALRGARVRVVEPFGTPMPDQTPGHVGVSLALTKALVEANRARFQIKSVPRSGTLIEVTLPQTATVA